MGKKIRHHLVSQGYLRAWTDETERRVIYIDKSTRSAKLVGIRDVFVAPRFLLFDTPDGPSDALETEFGRIEGKVTTPMRQYVDGADTESHHLAVKAMIALHFARSGAIKGLYPKLWEQTVSDYSKAAEGDEDLIEAFRADQGRPPLRGELGRMLEEQAKKAESSNHMLVQSIERLYSRALGFLQDQYLQRVSIARPSRGEFVVADSPVVLRDGSRGSAIEPIALLEASLLWFPLSPTVGVALSSDPLPDAAIDDQATWSINSITWEYSHRFLAARPGSNVNRALGYPGKSIAIAT